MNKKDFQHSTKSKLGIMFLGTFWGKKIEFFSGNKKFPGFFVKIFGAWVEKVWQGFQNCILCAQRIILGWKHFFEKSISFLDFERKLFWFRAKNFRHVSKLISSCPVEHFGFFSKKINLRQGVKKFWTLGKIFLARLWKLPFTCQEDYVWVKNVNMFTSNCQTTEKSRHTERMTFLS